MTDKIKPFYKIVRASSLKEGDQIYIRLRDDELPEIYHKVSPYRGAEKVRREFLKHPFKHCDVSTIRHFGSKIAILARCRRSAKPEDGYRNYTRLVEGDSWQGLFIGWHEGKLP